jgi:hypothetical protein
MGEFRVEKSDFKVPPEDSYFLDLIWIESVEYTQGPAYKWHWRIADILAQKEWAGIPVSSLTSRTPTLKNRFGKFLEAIRGALEEGVGGTTEDICLASYRVKGFVVHKKDIVDNEEVTFCNVERLIEGSAKRGEGAGIQGAGDKLKPIINEYLAKVGKPLLKIEESNAGKSGASTTQKASTEQKPQKKSEIPW